MIRNSGVEWTGPSWNPWQGCVKKLIEIDGKIKVRPECVHCYMYREKKRYGQKPQVVVRSSPSTFKKPLKVQREVEKGLRPKIEDRMVFTCSWTDWMNPEADEWRPEAWDIIRACPDLIFQILTKLPERFNDHLPPYWDEIKDRCWVGVTVGVQEAVDPMIEQLRQIDAPTRWLSVEPMLGPIDLRPYLIQPTSRMTMVSGRMIPSEPLEPIPFNWVVIGGESESVENAREFKLEWAYDLLAQLHGTGVRIFVKQMGDYPTYNGENLRSLYGPKGKEWDRWPGSLRIRQFPINLEAAI